MSNALYEIALRNERDVVQARQRAREIAGLLGFDNQEQIRIATATSEMARNSFRYARNGKVVCHFQSAQKFKSRHAALGFSDQAALDDGTMWPTVYGLKKLPAADEQRISARVKKAVG